ncbi:MAG: restriction endonuclease [Candidatus Schekmanbacteria bacterium RBG_16_38_10]|uniref:Restriction endonuclease n=1 Tax=Candidatus Schekmanbacteria bacterium RBG_16_38_10 TaxID=1817879 RepID=A0A1F7RRE0_9BACT|nr:MAG: restriction endonuclease [Candidatus Schekmanbacteria bacterium RBG_16_38_10]
MMIPDFQSTMLPLLKSLNDDKIRDSKELREFMANNFRITDAEQKIKTPNGKQFLFYNRVAWAISYLKMGELIIVPERGKYKISELGKNILKNTPDKITIKFLKTLPNFFINRNPNKEKHIIEEDEDEEEVIDKTPDELIELGISQINNELSNLLMAQIKSCSSYFFEQIVIDLLLKMGYGGSDIENGEVTSKSGDEGIDGIIKEDKLGLDKIYVQAKKWENTVGRPDIQKFVGALHGKRAKKGIFITTSNFTKEAIEYVNNLDVVIILIDGNKLTTLMIENDLGVTVKNIYKIRKIDTDYFIED